MRMNTHTTGATDVPVSYTTQALANMRAPGSNEMLVGKDGDINAGSRSELMRRLVDIAAMIESGQPQKEAAHSLRETQQLRREALAAAWNDESGQEFAALGAEVAADITQRLQRIGFMRRVLHRSDVAQGGNPRLRLREPKVRAVTVVGPTQVHHQVVRDKFFYPTEINVVANPRVTEIELNQGSEDLLEEMRMDGQEAIMVSEDRLLLKQMEVASGIFNTVTFFSGSLTPTALATGQERINDWNLTPVNMMLAMDLVKDITTGSAFNNDNFFDPVSRLEIVMTGIIGTLLGMQISTDGYRDPRLKVLNRGEVYITAQPNFIGGYSDRGPVQSEPRVNDKNFPGRGWFMYEIISSAIVNAKGVSRVARM